MTSVNNNRDHLAEVGALMFNGVKFCLLLLIAVLLCACSGMAPVGSSDPTGRLARIIDKGELVLGTTGMMPPLNMLANDGEVIGFEIDIARIMAAELGVALKVETMPFYQLLPALELNTVDIVLSGMSITPIANLRVAFVGPYYRSGKAILAKTKTIANVTNATVIDKPSTKLAALKGSTSQVYVEQFLPKAQLTLVDDYEVAIKLLRQEKVQALIADYPVCLVARMRYPEDDFMPIRAPLTYEPYGLALPADDYHFINWAENFFARLEGSNNLESLRQQWFERGDWLDRI